MRSSAVSHARRIGPGSHALFLIPAAIYLAAFAVFPFVQLLRMSVAEVSSGNLFKAWPFVGIENFAAVLASGAFMPALQNTLIYVAVILIIGEGGGLCAALLLRGTGRIVGGVLGLLVFAWAVPSVINGTVWKFLLSDVGPINTLLLMFGVSPVDWLIDRNIALVSVAFVNGWASLPFSALIFRAALLDIPPDLIEAAEVDGGSSGQVLRHIVLPLLRPTALVLSVLVIVYAFRSFDYLFVMTSGGPGSITTTIPYLTYKLAFESFDFGAGAATAVIAVLIVLVLALVYTRAVLKEERR